MFFEAFTEEFFFRGVLFLYLLSKTNVKIAYLTSVPAFVLMHPQHFTSLFIISTVTQAILLTVITHKTKNIIGPWVAHGLNRILPSAIRLFL
jgi:membrane protease YdiL (CAAX protease family)